MCWKLVQQFSAHCCAIKSYGVLDWIVVILVWFKRSLLHSAAQVSRQSCPWPLKLMTSQAVEGIWICTGGYGWLRGKWAKNVIIPSANYYLQKICYCVKIWAHMPLCLFQSLNVGSKFLHMISRQKKYLAGSVISFSTQHVSDFQSIKVDPNWMLFHLWYMYSLNRLSHVKLSFIKLK